MIAAGAGGSRSSHLAASVGAVSPLDRGPGVCQCGFTLVELIIVLVLGAVLAVFAAPRLTGLGDFNARGFHDETMSLLRYAQKAAIAQRRPVCVVFGAAGAVLRMDSDRNAASGTSGCEADATGPRGDTPGSIAARGGVQYQAVPATVVFDGLGAPAAGATIQVNGNARQVTVEATTGYVHD